MNVLKNINVVSIFLVYIYLLLIQKLNTKKLKWLTMCSSIWLGNIHKKWPLNILSVTAKVLLYTKQKWTNWSKISAMDSPGHPPWKQNMNYSWLLLTKSFSSCQMHPFTVKKRPIPSFISCWSRRVLFPVVIP